MVDMAVAVQPRAVTTQLDLALHLSRRIHTLLGWKRKLLAAAGTERRVVIVHIVNEGNVP